MPCAAKHWLAALHLAVNQPVPDGARSTGLARMRAHGWQPTSLAFMAACRTRESPQAFTRSHNPKGHADPERVIRPLKAEGLGLQEWTGPFALIRTRAAGVGDDNEHYLHAALGDKPPRQFEREYHASHSPPFVAA